MGAGKNSESLAEGVTQFFGQLTNDLRRGRVCRVRISPLQVRVSANELIRRRSHLFAKLTREQEDWGLSVSFRRRVRPSAAHPHGRDITGDFAIVSVHDALSLLVSTLALDAHKAGPHLLCRKAYPLAKRPFFSSDALGTAVREMASERGWTAIAIDAMGYDHAERFRRDMREQPIEEALAEMREQGRYIHRLEVSFTTEQSTEVLRASFDRHASVSIRRGPVEALVTGFILPTVTASVTRPERYSISLNPKPREQEVLQLTFPNEPFVTRADMSALCGALRRGEGLGVTVLHLNPYLQAQVVDMLTGAAIDMVVLDRSRVSLIPRSQGAELSLERMTATLLRHFGEGQVNRVPIS